MNGLARTRNAIAVERKPLGCELNGHSSIEEISQVVSQRMQMHFLFLKTNKQQTNEINLAE